ncbi:serine/threonine/dual specificity protein kinase, catalytic domain-containing protein [Artemisia annua]|uniref:Serine/threonine/dual specificity protein kinase, catalytic domain-containing protein n=1 Tax=Artemisia annua TaxID=35608 RepID=A0A2U1MWT6_ARTAN|nr:serine/threonine/dual specificity protein kinase, catalytic domain-containing protein [Artemisia annua]
MHGHVKNFNILLDKNWSGMISDSGLSKTGPTIQSSSCVDTSVKGMFEYIGTWIQSIPIPTRQQFNHLHMHFETCNEVDTVSKMLTIFEDY